MFLIRFIFKTFFLLFFMLLLVVGAFVAIGMFAAPKFAPTLADEWLEGKTGFSLAVDQFDVAYMDGSMALSGVRVENPSKYQDKRFLSLNALEGDLEWGSVLREEVVLNRALVDVSQVVVVQGAGGQMNVVEFKEGLEKKEVAKVSEPVGRPKSGGSGGGKKLFKGPEGYVIKSLTVRIGELVVVGVPTPKSKTKVIKVNYTKEFRNVRDLGSVAEQIGEEMKQYGAGILAQAILDEPIRIIGDTTGEVLGEVRDGVIENISDPKKVKEVLKNAPKELKRVPKALKEDIKNIFDSL